MELDSSQLCAFTQHCRVEHNGSPAKLSQIDVEFVDLQAFALDV